MLGAVYYVGTASGLVIVFFTVMYVVSVLLTQAIYQWYVPYPLATPHTSTARHLCPSRHLYYLSLLPGASRDLCGLQEGRRLEAQPA